MRSLAPLLAILLVVTASVAHAAPVPVMLLPFGEDDEEQRKLYDAIELELELSEDVVIAPGAPLFSELDARDITGVAPDRLADALTILEQQALLYAVFPPDEAHAVIVLFRANDASIVFARDIVIQDAAWKPREQVVDPVLEIVRGLRTAESLSSEELVSLGLAEAETPDRAPVEVEDPVDETPADGNDEPNPEEDDGDGDRRLVEDGGGGDDGDDEGAPPYGVDRFGRIAFAYAPTLLQYRACSPTATPPLPFLCSPSDDLSVTEVLVNPLQSPIGFSVAGEAFAFQTVGLVFDASLYQAQLTILDGAGIRLRTISPNPFSVVGGSATVALALRTSLDLGGVGLSFGGRAGYQLSLAQTDPTTTTADGESFILLPSWTSHRGLVGGSAMVGLFEVVRLWTDLDLLFGEHTETPTRVGNAPTGVGARAQGGIDIDVFAGLYIRLGMDASGYSVNTSRADDDDVRRTFAPNDARFVAGQVRLLELRGTLGVGYHY